MNKSRVVAGLTCIGALLCNAASSAQTLDPVFANGFESGLVAFAPSLSTVATGTSSIATAYTPLSVTLDAVAASPTFVPIISSNPARLTVSGGGATVATGQSTAVVLVNGLVDSPVPVTLWATLGNTLGASVRVERALNETGTGAEADYCVLQFPTTLSVPVGTSSAPVFGRLYEAGVTDPVGAPVGWIAQVGYGPDSTDPRLLTGWRFFDASYNTQFGNDDEFQASITAPANPGTYSYAYRFSNDGGGSWTYCDTDGAGSGAGLDFSVAAQGVMTATDPYAGLVINEVDYDNVGTDTAEFIELYNSSPLTINPSGASLVLINGTGGTEYARYDLAAAGPINPGQYLVLHSSNVTLPAGTPELLFPVTDNNIQNGAPDAVALIDTATLRVLDALSYEGSVTAAVIAGFPGTHNLVEGSPCTAVDSNTTQGSLSRIPNGNDSGNDAVDWAFAATPTPGTANVP
jgi:hypothetical protein